MYTHIYFSNIEIFNAECNSKGLTQTAVSYEYGETLGAINYDTMQKLIICPVAYANASMMEQGH